MPESERSMTFYHVARVDGLEKRVETPTSMTENFVNRDDFLVYRHVEFTGRQKKFGPSECTSERPIQVQRYHRASDWSTFKICLNNSNPNRRSLIWVGLGGGDVSAT